ncbi:CCA tRNA nucleotidyltransferase [Rossellomorea arthrocnemi]|jgi:tRNA nucleotidyltransferase (CCA-adding enzyme)|uniref:CCA tRNA nucleotidyltransferase n=1 Tax=Rossellomorea arthrocnemi TaxID=2769542 RepID=UPI001917D3CF|nr:CCA tRNA nucleotidyltransferase [Rossellomorea arthrocnemi]
MLPTIFQQAVPVLRKLEKAGYEAYFVGGSVRDYILGRAINDVDIATSAYPQEVKGIFQKTFDVGIDHGTILVMDEGKEYEITTFRTESAYADYRRPDKVEFIRSLEEDLKRRDFTMNSMAMDRDGIVKDPFNGKEDIHNRLIRTVGSPELRFSEDALRMMRAVRFVSQLGFGLEPSTLSALKEHSKLLEHIAVERKTMEFEKILQGKWKQEGLNLLVHTNLYQELPNLSRYSEQLKYSANRSGLDKLNKNQTWLLLLTHFVEDDIEGFLKDWRLPTKMIRARSKELEILKEREVSGWTKTLLYRAGLEAAVNVEKVYGCLKESSDFSEEKVMEQYHKLAISSRHELDVTGTDLMTWTDKKGGPWIKELLSDIESAIINETITNEKEVIRRWLKTCNRL